MQFHTENESLLLGTLPEKADLDTLQHVNDVVVLRGLKTIIEVFGDPEETTKQKISAFSAVTKFGMYLEHRKLNKKILDNEIPETITLEEIMNDEPDS